MIAITDLKTEYRVNPIGIDIQKPRFLWAFTSDRKNTMQQSYVIHVASSEGIVWDSGEVRSSQSVHVLYAGMALKPCTRYTVKVKITDNYGETASLEGWFETGLMSYQNFDAGWITHGYNDDFEPCPVFYKDFSLSGKIKCARVYASALGIYELMLNDEKVGDAFFAPGWTNYKARVQYQTYDITNLLKENNRILMTVGNGWFKGIYGYENKPNNYGNRTAVIAQLQIEYTDGTCETIITDESWHYTTGPRRFSEIYNGETIDFTYTANKGGNALSFEYPTSVLTAQECEFVRITKRIKPQKLIITPKGEAVLDFGQNLTGIVEARLDCPKGTKVVLNHAEVLDKDGNFYTENLRNAKATDTFICSGGQDVFLPAFTYHGFRYLRIEGLGKNIDTNGFTACVLYTDLEQTGSFNCSHSGVRQLQSNIQWSQRDNFLDIPTDCPQRDERLGWTGDAQVFASTAAFNMNVSLFFTKWLKDLATEQTLDHGVPHVIPNILGKAEGAAAWSDAATIIPWTMYMVYGDSRILSEQYPSMKMWVEYIRSKAGPNKLWQTGFQYGDWLGLDKEEGVDRIGATDVYLIANAFYAYSTKLLTQAAKVLGYHDDEEEYHKLYNQIIDAFRLEYITQTGRLVSETQTACILVLYFNLAEEKHRKCILHSLLENLARHNNHLVTGFVGTPYLCKTLTDNGQHVVAGDIFLKKDYPSWLYEVGTGATTIWERWNSMLPDGSIENTGMNSFNHYAYGSIGNWMYEKLGGLQIVEPGYRKSRIAPMPINGITWAEVSLKTLYGKLACQWKYENMIFKVDITIPANTNAVVVLPGKNEEFELGSGSYHFEYKTIL